jgi:anti-sigma B factor antagonist
VLQRSTAIPSRGRSLGERPILDVAPDLGIRAPCQKGAPAMIPSRPPPEVIALTAHPDNATAYTRIGGDVDIDNEAGRDGGGQSPTTMARAARRPPVTARHHTGTDGMTGPDESPDFRQAGARPDLAPVVPGDSYQPAGGCLAPPSTAQPYAANTNGVTTMVVGGDGGLRASLVIELHIDESTGFMRIALLGEMDLSNVATLTEALASTYTNSVTKAITVDLAELTFLDSTGIAALMNARRAASAQGIPFTVINARGMVLRLFEVTGVLTVLSGEGVGENRSA